jgi:hypothetical protein
VSPSALAAIRQRSFSLRDTTRYFFGNIYLTFIFTAADCGLFPHFFQMQWFILEIDCSYLKM